MCNANWRRPPRLAMAALGWKRVSAACLAFAGMPRLAIDELCEAFEAPVPSPAGGSAAAAVAAIAASLVVMVGRGSPAWSDGAQAAVSAAGLRQRLLALGGEDEEAVAALLVASRTAARVESGADRAGFVQALARASQVPLEIAERAADVAALAARAADEGKRPMRADADAAAALAVAAARVALAIVDANLTAPGLPQAEVDRLQKAVQFTSARVAGS